MDNSSEQQNSARFPEIFPSSAQTPSVEGNVLLAFHGLFCFTHNREEGVCEVGVHAKAPDHEFHVLVVEYDPETPEDYKLVYSFDGEQHGRSIGPILLDVVRPSRPGVSFFQPPMDNDELHELDWRRVPDLEGPNFYNQPLEMKLKALRPRLYIRNGLFFCLPTNYEFSRVAEEESEEDSDDAINLGEIAFLILADISHEEGGYTTLKIANKDLKFRSTVGKSYIIFFANVCPQYEDVCKHDPKSPIKERRNDFYLYYKTFRKPGGKKEFGLRMTNPDDRDDKDFAVSPTRAAFLRLFEIEILKGILSNHEAPCGGAGYGQGGGPGFAGS